MASVVPAPHPVQNAKDVPQQKSSAAYWRKLGLKFVRTWKRMQVSYYGGKYSIHRVLALDEFVRSTSFGQVILICATTPVPMIALVFGQELIPLQSLNEGWSANYGFWMRTAVLVCISTHAIVVQMTYLIDGFTVSRWQMLQLYVLVPSIVVGLVMVVCANLVFPIPFFVLLVMPVFFVLLAISVRIVVGSRGVQCMLAHRDQLEQCIRFMSAQASTLIIFPAYEMLFRVCEGTKYQLFVIILLPMIKVAAKNIVLHYAKSLEDMIPVEVIFTADFFNAVYVATCMQKTSSVVTVSAITITDLSQTMVMLYGLQRRTSSILRRLRWTLDDRISNESMLAMICVLCRNPTSFRSQVHGGIRRRSCLPHQISMASKTLLDSLDQIFDENESQPQKTLEPPHLAVVDETSARIKSVDTFRLPEHSKSYQHLSKRPTILVESLETLFTTECLIITAYLEAFMPLFYCSYMLVMTQLPNEQYHTEMSGVTRENVVSTILPLFVFGLLQIATFVLLVMVIMRNCGMRALYQLAFVLKTQRSLVLCKMMLWMMLTLCFRVIHFGVDFKFRFVSLGFPRYWVPMG